MNPTAKINKGSDGSRKAAKIAKLKLQLPLHLMLLPGLIIVLIYNYIPMGGLAMAFQNYKPALGFFKSKWVGWENFKMLFSFPDFSKIIYNTIFIAITKLILGLIIPIIFAFLINEVKNRYFVKTVQTLAYLPNFLSWVILGGIFANILSPSTGIVNKFLELIGLEPQYFLGNNALFPWTLIITDVWKNFGYGSIVYLAALTGIDSSLYEAAAIDGAGKFRQTLAVTLPGIAPIVFVMAILSLGNILNAGFDQVFNMYSPQVYESGDILDTFIYRLGLEQAQFSLSTAVGLFKSIISFVLISFSYFMAHKYGDYRIF